MPAQGPVELEEVAVRQRRPDGLPQLVLRDRVQRRGVHVGGVVAVQHLADEPGIGEPSAHRRQHARPELGRHAVGGVQPPAVDPPRQPVRHHVADERGDRGFVVIELDERVVALEDVGPRPVRRVPVDAEPPGELSVRPLSQRAGHQGVRGPHVVEHAVEQQSQATRPARGDEGVEGLVVPEPRVDAVVVDGVVAVRRRGEHRAEHQPVRAERHRVVQPAEQPVQPRRQRRDVRLADRRAREPQGIHVPPHRVLDPAHRPSSSVRSTVSPWGGLMGRTGAGTDGWAARPRRRAGPG